MPRRNINKLFFLPLFLLSFFFTSRAGEGMWLPQLINALNHGEMQTMGLKLTAEQIYSVNNGSLKDAIVHFGGFCTGEVISDQGLILTNHHCGFSAIQSHSSLENNYLEDGFWAYQFNQELPNPGLYVKFIDRIDDVTEKMLKGIKPNMTKEERQSIIDLNKNKILAKTKVNSYQAVEIYPFFKGNQYFKFITTTYDDIRLVGAPPSSIGKFGADTDNWVWPRHTGDFSLFRIYADSNGNPAPHSINNKPLKPKHSLPISLDGVAPGDFTMILGFPGKTNEYIPAAGVKSLVETIHPTRIKVREQSLKVIDTYMRKDPQIKIQYASTFASLANGWKKWIGVIEGIQRTNGMQKKLDYQAKFTKRLQIQKRKYPDAYYTVLQDLNLAYAKLEPYALAATLQQEITSINIDLLKVSSYLNILTQRYQNNGEAGYNELKVRLVPFLQDFFKNYNPQVDKDVFSSLMEIYHSSMPPEFIAQMVAKNMDPIKDNMVQDWANHLYSTTSFTHKESLLQTLNLSPDKAIEIFQKDPAYQLIQNMQEHHNQHVAPTHSKLTNQIEELMQVYMKAQMDIMSEKKFYPDANGTLRLTYGQVQGYNPRDAVNYTPITYLDGVMEKYKPGDYEFDLPPRLIELYQNQDYGQYSQTIDGQPKLPICFIGTNHTSGGNSGSPAIDAHGNLIGLNFDRVWEGTMSDINYDSSICRNIMVDIRYVLFIIDKYAGATRLIDEMELKHPKKLK